MKKYTQYIPIKDNAYLNPILTFFFCLLIFLLLGNTGDFMHTAIDKEHFLPIHTFLEFLSVLFGFAIFTLIFYAYHQNSRLRHLLLACAFLIGSFLDVLHTLSYEGMPDFFAPNNSSIPVTYWVFARFIMAVGFLLAIYTPPERTTRISRWFALGLSMLLSLILFYAVTFRLEVLPAFFIEGQGLTPLKIFTEYIIIALQTIAIAFSLREYKKTGDRTNLLFSTALVISIFSELCFTLYISVYDMYNLMGHIFKIIAYSVLFNVLFIQNVRHPYEQLKKAEALQKKHARTLEHEIDKAKFEIMETNSKLYNDIELAREIQQSMLPDRKLGCPGIDFYSAFIPCESLSGDFFNVFCIDDEHVGFYLADVSGHGISSAMITIFMDRTILSNKLEPQRKEVLLCPSKVLIDLFDQFNSSRFPDEMYLLIFYGVFNNRTREFSYSSAGLNTQPLILSGPNIYSLVTKSPFPICKMAPYYKPEYRNSKLSLRPGDRILIYSDGLVESVNRDGRAFGEKRLMEILKNSVGLDARDLYFEIFDRFSCFVLDEKVEDDVTILMGDVL